MALGAVYAYGTARSRVRGVRGFDLGDPPPPGSEAFARLVDSLAGAPVRPGNRVQILRNGVETFPAMLEAIASARRTIDFSSYIYWPGAITERFTAALVERARAGVEVNFLLDAYGSAKRLHDHVERLENAGVKVALFRSPRWYNVDKLNNRMHRRLLVIDGRVGFAGGVGIADVWTGDAEDPQHWRETHIRVEGPAVRDIFGGFGDCWTVATREVLTEAHHPEVTPFDDGVELQVVRSSPAAGGTTAARLFHAAIAGAEKRLWLTTAYFAPGPAGIEALAAAALRGVDVRLLLNGPNIDKEAVRKAGQNQFGALLEAGVRIFEYQPTMLHAKVLIADGWANVGSANTDERSFAYDSELVVNMSDADSVETLAGQFLDDLAVSAEIDLARWRRRPVLRRVAETAGDLLRQSF